MQAEPFTDASPYPQDPRTGPSARVEKWVQHAASLLSVWLSDEWTWDRRPLADYVAMVEIEFAEIRRPLWRSGQACQAAPVPVALPEPWPQAMGDCWHPAWFGLVEAWALDGIWLHPESHYNVDQVLFSRDQGGLYIGCVDRDNPAAPRRYRRDKDPQTNDLGVIHFPLYPYRALPYLAAGWSSRDAMLVTAGLR